MRRDFFKTEVKGLVYALFAWVINAFALLNTLDRAPVRDDNGVIWRHSSAPFDGNKSSVWNSAAGGVRCAFDF
jgi:hypothetical protein